MVSLTPLIRLLGENQKNYDASALIKQLEETKKLLETGIVKEETETEPMLFQMSEKQLDALLTKLKEIRSKITTVK
jgi:hypothetical protein